MILHVRGGISIPRDGVAARMVNAAFRVHPAAQQEGPNAKLRAPCFPLIYDFDEDEIRVHLIHARALRSRRSDVRRLVITPAR
jgi:hypothetical protein